MFKKIFIICSGLIGLSVLLVVAAYLGLVVFSAGSKIDKESVQDILSRQSPVYYNDGETVMGVFFRGSHRFYVPYDRLPEDFINAIVATEDHEFFSHSGIDLSGILRAFIANIKAGRIVQGGSTITQQTAKNLFKRQGRSLQAKLRELLYALRLEHHYTKEDILTFYANQFYVSGNGRGLGIAARYFFDKEVDELTLVECAFIAGSVKAPNHYNPFTKSDPAKKKLARERAEERTAYVLRQMHDLGMIDSRAYRQALEKPVSFNKGQMRYPLNTVMDMVEDDLNVDVIRQALVDHGIDNAATSGISIFTTIDRKIQNTVVQSLRSNLSRLDIRLSGYERKKIQDRYTGLNLENRSSPEKGDFLLARVTGINKGDEPRVEVNLAGEREDGATGIIREEGLRPALTALVRYERRRWSEPGEEDWPLLLDQIREGDLIYTSVKGRSDKTGEYGLALEKYPELQGGALVMRDGMIKGVIGGYNNLHYNRVIRARRPMGSTFKVPLYAAALQLGWNSLDLLDNRRRGFVYHDNPYIPKPDHYSPYEKTSMAWAGVKSENVASVWLLYHLCDRLTSAQFQDLLANLGLARKKDESYHQYKRRVRDKMGIVVDGQTLEHTAFVAALSNCRADLAFAGREDEFPVLQRFVYSDRLTDLMEEDAENEDDEDREAGIKKEISGYNFERFRDLRDRLLGFKTLLDDSEDIPVHNLYIRSSSERDILSDREYRRAVSDADYAFAPEKPGDNWRQVRRNEFLELLSEMDKTERKMFWDSVKLDNLLSMETVRIVDNSLQNELKRLKDYRPYAPEVLHSVPDFRVMAGIEYLRGLCKAAGIRSELEPVLSFPLGSNVVSLYELTRLYESLLTGEIKNSGSDGNPPVRMISRIEGPDGDVIYSADPESRKIIDSQTSLEIADILKNVVSYGTGKYAARKVKIRENPSSRGAEKLTGNLQMPLFGKTGTADSYRNSTFVGAVPGISDSGNGVNLEKPFMVGAYLGYDDNRPMVRTSTHITGSSGALRAWTGIAQDIVRYESYADSLDFVDLAFAGARKVPLHYPDLGQIYVPVDRKSGVPLGGQQNARQAETGPASVATFGEMDNKDEPQLERWYRPYWRQNNKRSDKDS